MAHLSFVLFFSLSLTIFFLFPLSVDNLSLNLLIHGLVCEELVIVFPKGITQLFKHKVCFLTTNMKYELSDAFILICITMYFLKWRNIVAADKLNACNSCMSCNCRTLTKVHVYQHKLLIVTLVLFTWYF